MKGVMKWIKRFCLLLALLLPFTTPALAKAPTDIGYGAVNAASGVYSFCVAVAKAINKNAPDIRCTVIESGGGNANVELLRKKEVQMGLAAQATLSAAWEGKFGYEKPFPELRTLWVSRTNLITIFVREDSGIKTFADLNGKRMGNLAGTSSERLMLQVDSVSDVNPGWQSLSASALISATKNRQIVGFVKAGAPDSTVLQVAASIPIRLISVPEDVMERSFKKFGGQISKGVIPSGTYPGQDKDVLAFAMVITDASTSNMAEDVIYEAVKAVYAGRADIAASYKPAVDFGDWPKNTIDKAYVPLHAGTVKFLKKDLKMTVPVHLIPPEAK
ncbi:MAG: TAXI family TRAP transporter solute-binding subunit [Chloroflexota bacterium]